MIRNIYKVIYLVLSTFSYLWGTLYFIYAAKVEAIASTLPKPINLDTLQIIAEREVNTLTTIMSGFFFLLLGPLLLCFVFMTLWICFSPYLYSARYYIIVTAVGYLFMKVVICLHPDNCYYLLVD